MKKVQIGLTSQAAQNKEGIMLLSDKEAVILQLLTTKDEMFGLELARVSQGRIKRGTVYVTLQRLEKAECVTSHPEERRSGAIGPTRRLYAITAKGKRALEIKEQVVEVVRKLLSNENDQSLKDASQTHWLWPLSEVPISRVTLVTGHDGAFGTVRRYDRHTGVDLYCEEGTCVQAVEDGVVVAIENFTGAAADSPWWRDTQAVLVEGRSGVVLYGEVKPSVQEGQLIQAGDEVGRVLRVLIEDKGLPMTMLHLELYVPGTNRSVWWYHHEPMPEVLRDPTELLRWAYQAAQPAKTK